MKDGQEQRREEANEEEGAIVLLVSTVTVTIYPVETVHSIISSVRLGRQVLV